MSRQLSPETAAVRELLTADAATTYSVAKPVLEAKGVKVEENNFNVIKHNFKKQNEKVKKTKPVKVETPEIQVNVQDAVRFVFESGGVEKVETRIKSEVALLKAFKAFMATGKQKSA